MPSDRRLEANPGLAWLDGPIRAIRRSRALRKKLLYFFHVQRNLKWAIFVHIEGFLSAILEPAELRGTPMGSSDPPNAKGVA